MKNYTPHYILGTLAVCLLATLPSFAQEKALEKTLAQTVMEQRINQSTSVLFGAIGDMSVAKTDRERDAILHTVKDALDNDANVHAQCVRSEAEELTVLELIVHLGVEGNAGYFANLYNLVVSYGANPLKDLRPPYSRLAKQLPLEQSNAWQKIVESTPVVTTQKPSTPQAFVRSTTLTICIPEEYNKYSCRKLKKLEKKGLLPKPTFINTDTVIKPVVQQPEQKSSVFRPAAKSVTIVIPSEYDKYSCKKLKKMEKEGTLPKAQIIYNK